MAHKWHINVHRIFLIKIDIKFVLIGVIKQQIQNIQYLDIDKKYKRKRMDKGRGGIRTWALLDLYKEHNHWADMLLLVSFRSHANITEHVFNRKLTGTVKRKNELAGT